MRRLILMRHAKAAKHGPTGKDRDRPLEERGRGDARDIGAYLRRQAMLPDLALVSTAVRTRETWDCLSADWPAVAVEHHDALYGADPAELLAAVRATTVQDPHRLLVLAHNPGLHEFALALVASASGAAGAELADHLPTAGVVVIDFAVRGWNEVTFRRGRLEAFVTPRQLKDAPGATHPEKHG
ncbi:MAG: SixA phosphatase family protein [Xanthobacteraceae bacterium]